MTKMVIKAMPSTQEYSVMGPSRHGFVRESCAGERSCGVSVYGRVRMAERTYVDEGRGDDDA